MDQGCSFAEFRVAACAAANRALPPAESHRTSTGAAITALHAPFCSGLDRLQLPAAYCLQDESGGRCRQRCRSSLQQVCAQQHCTCTRVTTTCIHLLVMFSAACSRFGKQHRGTASNIRHSLQSFSSSSAAMQMLNCRVTGPVMQHSPSFPA